MGGERNICARQKKETELRTSLEEDMDKARMQ